MKKVGTVRSDQEILSRIARASGGKAHYKQLVREMGLGGGRERRVLLEQMQALVRRKLLVELESGAWSIPKVDENKGDAKPRSGGGVRSGGRAGATAGRFEGMEEMVRGGRERLLAGRLELHRDGFGFVRQDEGKGDDIFIAPNEIHGAMQGDQVLVDEFPPGRDGRRSGRIARVLTRRNPTVVGVFHYADWSKTIPNRGVFRRNYEDNSREFSGHSSGVSNNYVLPMDQRVASTIEIPEGMEVVVTSDATLHRMVGNEAKVTWEPKDPERPLEGIAVDVEITHFPGPGRPAKGRVIEVLGHPDAFGVDVEMLIRKHHIPHTFPVNVLAEADEVSVSGQKALDELASPPLIPQNARDEWGTRMVGEREDFRGLPIVTIDGETARDFDDAVLVRDLPNGKTELQVHIADVSWYVRPGSAIDTEARVRATSVYFPDRAVPMLPHALSSGMCSLLPNEDRMVLSCVMEIDPRGEVVGYRVCEGVIRSVRRCTYTSVQRCLNASGQKVEVGEADPSTLLRDDRKKGNDNRKSVTQEPTAEDFAERERVLLEQPELVEAFDRMLELALRLNAKRVRRGSIDFDLPEPIVEFDPDGNMKAIVKSERGWAHRLIEEFMLSANECVATWLESQGIASIYRIHETPDPKRIVDFEESASQFGQTLGIGNLPVKKFTMKSDRRDAHRSSARGRDSRAPQKHEVPDSIPVTPQMYQKLVRKIAGHPEERILSYLMLRSLKQARYAEKNEGHFALASPSYTHFTSPIRRYPDLIVHRLLREMLRDGASPLGSAILSTDKQPWGSTTVSKEQGVRSKKHGVDSPIAAEELNDIAVESSQAERRAADAERELIEWKKVKFMADKVGEDFHAVILSVTKYGFFVELNDLFIEGLVPLTSLVGDHYSFRDTDRTIVGSRGGHVFAMGQKVEVILDRIDRQEKRLQFALLPGTEPKVVSLRTRTKMEPKGGPQVGAKSEKASSPKRSGKAKTRARNKKNKGRR